MNDDRAPWIPPEPVIPPMQNPVGEEISHPWYPWYPLNSRLRNTHSIQPPLERDHDYHSQMQNNLPKNSRKLSDEELHQQIDWNRPFFPDSAKFSIPFKRSIIPLFPEELEFKRQMAIVEEADRKLRKKLDEDRKNAPRHIELGRLICSLKPADFGILTKEISEQIGKELKVSTDQYLSNVGKFFNDFSNFLGPAAKGSVFQCGDAFAATLSQTYRGAIADVNRRLENAKNAQKLRIIRMRMRRQSAEENRRLQLNERLTTIGRVISSLRADELLQMPENSSEEDEELLAEHFPEEIAARGEKIMENVFAFFDAVGFLIGEHAKYTVFRNPNETTHRICNVAEKSVRDRHYKRIRWAQVNDE